MRHILRNSLLLPVLRGSVVALLLLTLQQGRALAAEAETSQASQVLQETPQEFTVELGGSLDGAGSEDMQGILPGSVTVTATAAPTSEDFGLLDATNGGLPADMWKNSKRGSIEELLGLINGGISAPSIKHILLRLLLTQAEMPYNANAFAKDTFALRVQALIAMGFGDRALDMLDALPRSLHNSASMWFRFVLTLLRRDYTSACEQAALAVEKYEESNWQQAMIFCHAHSGQSDAAALGIELLREQNSLPPEFFMQAVEVLSGQRNKLSIVPETLTLFDSALLLSVVKDKELSRHIERLPLTALALLAANDKYNASLRDKAWSLLSPYRSHGDGLRAEKEADDKNGTPDATRQKPSFRQRFMTAWKSAGDKSSPRLLQRMYILGRALRIKPDVEMHKDKLLRRVEYSADFPSPLLRERLRRAAEAKRLGETLLLASLVAGGKDFRHVADYVLSDVIVALRLAGQPVSARAVAEDALDAVEWNKK